MQARYDLETAEIEFGDHLDQEVKVLDRSQYAPAEGGSPGSR